MLIALRIDDELVHSSADTETRRLVTPHAATKHDCDQRGATGQGGPPTLADQFEVMVFWMSDEPMLRGRTYLLRSRSDDGRRDSRPDQVQAEPLATSITRRQPSWNEAKSVCARLSWPSRSRSTQRSRRRPAAAWS